MKVEQPYPPDYSEVFIIGDTPVRFYFKTTNDWMSQILTATKDNDMAEYVCQIAVPFFDQYKNNWPEHFVKSFFNKL